MQYNEIKESIQRGEFILVKDKELKLFLYYDKYRVLIPVKRETFKKKYGVDEIYISSQNDLLNGSQIIKGIIRANQAQEIFALLERMEFAKGWNISANLWFVDNANSYIKGVDLCNVVYNGGTKKIEPLKYGFKAKVLKVIYLQGQKVLVNGRVNLDELIKYGLTVCDTAIYPNTSKKSKKEIDEIPVNEDKIDIKNNNNSTDNISSDIQELLDCDKKRCGLASYQREMLYDIKAGHWDLFESSDKEYKDEKLVSRDPKTDIKRNGIIGIDFGTKSTVVVKQEGSNEIRPIRIGSLSLKADVTDNDYENPTIISCMNIDEFLKKYNKKMGRPETSCDDLFVSYNAYNDYKNCSTENFYAYYSDLKQWANAEKKDAVVQDIRNREKYNLDEECSIEDKCLNPIEIYAYYIGMYINNMRNGIYLRYIMSFPVKYSKSTKELIRKSFENGLKKSLPNSIVEDEEIMSKFSVQYQISEPAAYAVTALEQTGFKPKDENEKYLYGIFDFGGGTTDFDFGVWRGADDDEYDKYNCDYVLECFGADSDVRLGGENILEMLAYHVFKNNKNMAAEKKIACALPADETAFIGGEQIINNSQSANRNLTLLKESLRPLWEQHDGWEEKYCAKNSNSSKENNSEAKKEVIEIQMYDFNGKPVPNCRFLIDTQELIELIKGRIKKGVDAFFKCIEKSILGNKAAQFASEKVYIFLAGNSCKSIFVKEIFENNINEYNKEYGKISGEEQNRYELINPLKSFDMDYKYMPNAKTSVAYGLVKSRPGGKIYVKKNYETDSNYETRFKYYLGTDRRGYFQCKLSPLVVDEEGENKTSYGIWNKFQGAGMGVARIYYTEDPRADSKAENIEIDNIPFHEILFDAEEDKYIFVRAVKPSVIEYVIAETIDEIGDNITVNASFMNKL